MVPSQKEGIEMLQLALRRLERLEDYVTRELKVCGEQVAVLNERTVGLMQNLSECMKKVSERGISISSLEKESERSKEFMDILNRYKESKDKECSTHKDAMFQLKVEIDKLINRCSPKKDKYKQLKLLAYIVGGLVAIIGAFIEILNKSGLFGFLKSIFQIHL